MAYLPQFIRRMVLAVAGCGVLLALTAPAALAHDQLRSSSPAKNAEVSSPERIELVFSSRVHFPAVVLRRTDNTQAPLGTPRTEGPKVTADVTQPLAPGGYVIAWRVVSSDGHPIEGEIPFTVTGSGEPSAPGESVAPTASAVQVSASPAPAAADEEAPSGIPWWIWAALAALAAIGAVVWYRTPRHDHPTPEE
ncbi:copper resistance CopC family protein [Streptosporangium sp. NPDC020145]|uniref:copper resistance CopC family protein n=1 Tax=Streptosporangium sp. NPDC020145 TaxID=3154694 RepID=UPI003412C6A7